MSKYVKNSFPPYRIVFVDTFVYKQIHVSLLQGLRSAAKYVTDSIDPDRCVYLSEELLSEFGIKSFSWAKMEVREVSRIVMVVPSSAVFLVSRLETS